MGERRWIDQRAVPLRDPDGSGGIHAVLAVSRDITDRIQASTALNQITRRLNEAQRVAQIGSWELDLAMNKLFWSDEIFRIFEIDPRGSRPPTRPSSRSFTPMTAKPSMPHISNP